MEPFLGKDRRNSQRVPVKITALGIFEGRRIAMYSENINLDGMFVLSADFIPARAVFSARIWLSTDQKPLQAYLTSCFIDRSWASYGIGVCISGICTADKTRWEDFYRGCLEAQAEQRQSPPAARPTPVKRHMVVVDGSLSPPALQILRQPWLEVSYAGSVKEAIALVKARPTDAVISDLRRPGVDGVALCRGLNQSRSQTRVVLLSDGAVPNDFLLGIHAGAALVIGKQCSHNVLVSRILQVLELRLPDSGPSPVTDSGRHLQASWNPAASGEYFAPSSRSLPAPLP